MQKYAKVCKSGQKPAKACKSVQKPAKACNRSAVLRNWLQNMCFENSVFFHFRERKLNISGVSKWETVREMLFDALVTELSNKSGPELASAFLI